MRPQSAESLRYEEVRFRDIPALFTSLRVSKENMPEGIYRYELRHDDESYTPCQLAKHIVINHYGTILTSTPVQLPADGYLDFEPDDLAFMPRSCVTIAEFLQSYPPANKVAIELFPMKPEEAPLFFSSLDESEDKARGCIGHVRGDFDGALYTTWWPHYWDQALNQEIFKRDIQRVVNWLKEDNSPLKDLASMDGFCRRHESCRIPGQSERCYGFRIESGLFRYMLRCTPLMGWYQVYLYCYSRDAVPEDAPKE